MLGKPKKDARWYTAPDMGWSRASGVGLFALLFVFTIHSTPIGSELENRLSRPFAFQLRHWWGKDPSIDSRLLIYSLGDQDRERFVNLEPSMTDWADLLTGLDRSKPRAILIPKLFAAPGDVEETAAFSERIKSLSTPVIALGFAIGGKISHRKSLSRDRPEFGFQWLFPLSQSAASDWLTGSELTPYGPHRNVKSAFTVGHLQYTPPLFPLGLDLGGSKAMLLAPVLIAQHREWRNGNLWLDDKPVGLINDRDILPNLPWPNQFRRYSLGGLLESLRRGENPSELDEEGKVILLLPSYYTGNSDMLPSPLGVLPGGLLTAAMVNSVLTGQWIRSVSLEAGGLILAGVIGVILGKALIGWQFWSALIALLSFVVLGRLFQFSAYGIESPWLMEAACLLTISLAVHLVRQRRADRRISRLRETLEGFVEPRRLEKILERPSCLTLEASNRLISVMFIDIVGFSSVAEQMEPKEAFFHLKGLLSELTTLIHEYDGTIDKTLGDGLLAFFGYSYSGVEQDNHADSALACALKIQRHVLDRNLQAAAENQPLFPVRIGINSTTVFIGDIGNNERIDLTIIGHGVNFAKRLEAACEPGNVLLSPSTKDLLQQSYCVQFYPKQIQIKHHESLFEAHECDPNQDRPEKAGAAVVAFRKRMGLERRDPRWPIPPTTVIKAKSPLGGGELVNFSLNGLSVNWDKYLGRGTTFSLNLFAREDEGISFPTLVCEVRWARPAGDQFLMGLEIKNLSAHERTELSESLRSILQKDSQSAAS